MVSSWHIGSVLYYTVYRSVITTTAATITTATINTTAKGVTLRFIWKGDEHVLSLKAVDELFLGGQILQTDFSVIFCSKIKRTPCLLINFFWVAF